MRTWHKKLTFRDRQILTAAAVALGLAPDGDRSVRTPHSGDQAIKALAGHLVSGSVSLQTLAAHLGSIAALRLAPPAALALEERQLRKAGDRGKWHDAVRVARRERLARRQAQTARAEAKQDAKRAKRAAWEQTRLQKDVEPTASIPVHPRLDPRFPRMWALRENGKTFRQIGDDLGISGQRVSQILGKARRLLKWPKEALQRKATCKRCGILVLLEPPSNASLCADCRNTRICIACGRGFARWEGRRKCQACRTAMHGKSKPDDATENGSARFPPPRRAARRHGTGPIVRQRKA